MTIFGIPKRGSTLEEQLRPLGITIGVLSVDIWTPVYMSFLLIFGEYVGRLIQLPHFGLYILLIFGMFLIRPVLCTLACWKHGERIREISLLNIDWRVETFNKNNLNASLRKQIFIRKIAVRLFLIACLMVPGIVFSMAPLLTIGTIEAAILMTDIRFYPFITGNRL